MVFQLKKFVNVAHHHTGLFGVTYVLMVLVVVVVKNLEPLRLSIYALGLPGQGISRAPKKDGNAVEKRMKNLNMKFFKG